MERRRKAMLCGRERRATYPGGTGRQFGRRGFASALDFERFLFTLGARRRPWVFRADTSSDAAMQLHSSPDLSRNLSGNESDSDQQDSVVHDARSKDLDDFVRPFASLLRDQDTEENEEDKREEDDGEEADTLVIAVSQPESALDIAVMALQLPCTVSYADFIHVAVQFVFYSYERLQHFRDADSVDYDELYLALSFSNFTRDIWGDDAPEDNDAGEWLTRLQHFFAVLRTGPYTRGGTTCTMEELLARLVPPQRVKDSEYPDNPVDTELSFNTESAYRDLDLTEVEDGHLQDFSDLAAAHVFETHAWLDDFSGDLQYDDELYDPQLLATEFYISYRTSLWVGTADDDTVWNTRISNLFRFFLALRTHDYARLTTSIPRECLVRLIGLQNLQVQEDSNAADSASNPILSELFLRLEISEPENQPRDPYLRNAFQHAATHIAFQTINATRKTPLDSFGSKAPQPSVETTARIIGQVRERYAVRLWPQFAEMDFLPEWLTEALQNYIWALTEIPAHRATRDGEDTLKVLDNILGLNQDELQGGFASAEARDDGDLADDIASVDEDDDGDLTGDGLECELKDCGFFESCVTPFATEADLGHHLIEMHGFGPEDAMSSVREAGIGLKMRFARKS